MKNEFVGKVELVRNAMLAVQRYPWEQGVCAQALLELGDETTAMAMAHDAILRQQPDGRLAVTGENTAVTDPAANGEAVWRGYEKTGLEFYKTGAQRMLDYLLTKAPRTENGAICHVDLVQDENGIWSKQIWVDSCYMAPPFFAVMGHLEEAVRQLELYFGFLQDDKTGLLNHIYDDGKKQFIRGKLWATGNGWALLGIARVCETALARGRKDLADKLAEMGRKLLDSMLAYKLEDGRFHDILNESDSFVEGAAAMMAACFVYRGIAGGWLSEEYKEYADTVADTMENYVDEFGIIRQVCGCPHFVSPGTSAESMAAYLMMHAWKQKIS